MVASLLHRPGLEWLNLNAEFLMHRQITHSCSLYRGDALDVLRSFDDACIDAVVTDPPYSSGSTFARQRGLSTSRKYQSSHTRKAYFDFLGDNRDQLSYLYWSSLWLGQCLRLCKPGAFLALFSDWRQYPTASLALQIGGFVWRGAIPWNKTLAARPQPGRFRDQCEYVLWGSAGKFTPHDKTCLPGVFTYAVKPSQKHHLAAKPVELMIDILRIVPKGATVLDPFAGSASTGVACARLGLGFIGIEQSPLIFDHAVARLQHELAQPGPAMP
jgi:site-specific DNA-methyltransferase (adenine-specific)